MVAYRGSQREGLSIKRVPLQPLVRPSPGLEAGDVSPAGVILNHPGLEATGMAGIANIHTTYSHSLQACVCQKNRIRKFLPIMGGL